MKIEKILMKIETAFIYNFKKKKNLQKLMRLKIADS
jgi:hypothetical protein